MNIEFEKITNITEGEFPLLHFLLHDLREEEATKRLFASLPCIGAFRVVCKELDLPRDSEQMIQACLDAAQSLIFPQAPSLKGYRLWLFLAHGVEQPDSRITRYKKLWSGIEQQYGVGIFRRELEVEIVSDEGLRYATLTELTIENFFIGMTLLRERRSSALFLSPLLETPTETSITALFWAAFQQEKGLPTASVKWPQLIAHRCPLGEILVRAGGSWDERKYYLEFFGLPEKLSLLEAGNKSIQFSSMIVT
jgi:hypothetical protein